MKAKVWNTSGGLCFLLWFTLIVVYADADEVSAKVTEPTSITKTENSPQNASKWSFVDPKTKVRCLIVQMQVNLSVLYARDSGGLNTVSLVVPAAAKNVSGNCSDEWQTIKVSTENVTVLLTFSRRDRIYVLEEFVFDVVVPENKNPVRVQYENGTLFETFIERSFYCRNPQRILASKSANVTVSNVWLEAFHESDSLDFNTPINCAEHHSEVIPLTVGLVLTIMITVVVGTYLFLIRCRFSEHYGLLQEESAADEESRTVEPEFDDRPTFVTTAAVN